VWIRESGSAGAIPSDRNESKVEQLTEPKGKPG
jgi:hypothetical protein